MPSKKKPAPPAPAKRKRADWEAIERDYRTGAFTLRELSAKHGASFTTIGDRARRDGWTQDLQQAVRQATSAKLIAELTVQESHKAVQSASQTVQAAAELNKQVILGQRARVAEATSVVLDLLGELRATTKSPDEIQAVFDKITEDMDPLALAAAQSQFRDFMRLHSRVGSAHKLMDALAKAQAIERQAFALDDEGANKQPPAKTDWANKSAEDAQAAYMVMVYGR